MFTKKQLKELEEIAALGYTFDIAASQLDMTYSDFIDEYSESPEAQKAWEKGESAFNVEQLTILIEKAKGGDQKAMELYKKIIDEKKAKMAALGTKKKQADVPDILFNPMNILKIDDSKLSEKIKEKEASKGKNNQSEEEEE
jgi:hypothetical protein